MPRRVIKIYLSSSADLTEERRFASEVLEQLNQSKAAERNVSFEMVSATDPNREELPLGEDLRIATSDLFVLLVWKHLGQPQAESLAEEFSFAQSAFKASNHPRLLTYFRSVSPSMMADPGEQLQRVIGFRNRIEEDEHQSFRYDYPLQWKDLFHEHLTRWLDSQAQTPSEVSLVPQLLPETWAEALGLRLQRELESIISPPHQNALMHAREALGLATQGKVTLAETHFSKALDLHEDPEVLHSFGVFLREVGSPDRAETIFQRLLTKSLAEKDVKPIYQSLAFTNLGLLYASRAAKKPILVTVGGLAGGIMTQLLANEYEVRWMDLKDSSFYLTRIGSPQNLAYGLATAFRSRETDSFGELVSRLYRYSSFQPRLDVLQTLISDISGRSGHKKSGALSELRYLVSIPDFTASQTSEIAPETVGALATYAARENPFAIDKVSQVYSGYPEVIKHLGPKPLTITLSSMAEREAALNPNKFFFLNDFQTHEYKLKSGKPFDENADIEGAESRSEGLYANSWFEYEKRVLERQTPLITGNSYNYFFNIERVRKFMLGVSDEFHEPLELAQGSKQQVQIEVVCPLLDMKKRRGVMRRTVHYYSGKGIRTQSFPLKPLAAGDYSLITRVFYGCRVLYRVIISIKVKDPEFRTSRPDVAYSSATNELSVR